MKNKLISRRAFLPGLLASGASAPVVFGRSSALTPARIAAAARYSAANRGKSMLVVEDGRTIFEDYPNGYHANEGHKIYSGTKTFWNVAALAAEEDGILKLSERASDTLPEWADDPTRSKIKIRELLNFTSGLDPYFELHEDGLSDRDALALRRAVVARPGGAFIYGPCSLQVFHLILKRRLAKKDIKPTQYLERRVLRPLGLGPQRYVQDNSGNPLLAAGFILSARQWAQLGKLIAADGHPVLARGTIEKAFDGSRPNVEFGLGIWNNSAAGRRSAREVNVEGMLHEKWSKQEWSDACLCRSAPTELVASIGSGEQRLYALPSAKLAVVRQGRESGFDDAKFLRLLFGS